MWALILFLPLAWGQLTVSTFSAGATVPTYVVSNDTQIFNIQGIVWNCTTPSPPLSSFGQFTSGKLDLARLLDCLKYYNASSCLQGSTFPPSSGSTNVNLFRGTMAVPQTVAVGAGQVAESIVFNFYVNATCNSVADSKASSRDVSTGTGAGTGTGSSTGTGTGTGTGASTGTGTGTGASTGTGTGTGSQSCVVVRTNLTNLNATSYSPVLPVPFFVPCANDNVVLSVWIDNPNTTKLGILATAFGGRTYYSDFITLTGTASALNGSLSGFYFMQTRTGTGDQIIKYSWAQQGFATVNNTFNLYASGLVAVSPDASSFTVTNTSEAVITTAEDPTRESATYSVKLSINPSDYTNDLAIYYISLIYRVHKKFIKIIAYSFSNNKFQTQQSGADVKFSFVGLSASQEQRAVNIAKVNCAQLSQSNAVKVDCASLSSSTSAQSNSGVTKSSSGLVAGAIVGIIIGSVALAIILALCIGYAVMKMQSAPQPHYPDKEGEPVPQYVNYAAPAEVYAPAPAAVPQIGYAPGPAPYTYA